MVRSKSIEAAMHETDAEVCTIPEVTMLVITCGERVILLLDPENTRRGWTFVSTTVREDEEPVDAIRRTTYEKLAVDLQDACIRFVKRKERKGVSFSSFTVVLPEEGFEDLVGTGPRGHSVRAIPISELSKYLDRGRYDMGASEKTGIPHL